MEAAESLFECLEQVPDPRMARGVRHPFHLRLTLSSHSASDPFKPFCV